MPSTVKNICKRIVFLDQGGDPLELARHITSSVVALAEQETKIKQHQAVAL